MNPAYFAGLFDGEGNIRIQAFNGGSCFKVRCALVNTHLPVIMAVQDTFGGRFEIRDVPSRPTHRQSFSIRWDGTNIVKRMLESIQPFSIVKRAEIDLVLNEFIPSMNTKQRGKLPPGLIDSRKEMRARLSALKVIAFPLERAS